MPIQGLLAHAACGLNRKDGYFAVTCIQGKTRPGRARPCCYAQHSGNLTQLHLQLRRAWHHNSFRQHNQLRMLFLRRCSCLLTVAHAAIAEMLTAKVTASQSRGACLLEHREGHVGDDVRGALHKRLPLLQTYVAISCQVCLLQCLPETHAFLGTVTEGRRQNQGVDVLFQAVADASHATLALRILICRGAQAVTQLQCASKSVHNYLNSKCS